jgi:hypothetical protein
MKGTAYIVYLAMRRKIKLLIRSIYAPRKTSLYLALHAMLTQMRTSTVESPAKLESPVLGEEQLFGRP